MVISGKQHSKEVMACLNPQLCLLECATPLQPFKPWWMRLSVTWRQKGGSSFTWMTSLSSPKTWSRTFSASYKCFNDWKRMTYIWNQRNAPLDNQSGVPWTYFPGKPDINGPSETKWDSRLAYANHCETSTILSRIWKLLLMIYPWVWKPHLIPQWPPTKEPEI